MALGITYDSQQLVMFDPATGYAKGSASANGGSILDADYSSVRGDMYWAVAKDGLDLIRRAPVFGHGSGPTGAVAYGRRVTVSPDGRFMAYVHDPDGPEKGSLMEEIVVRDLDTGTERRFPGPPVPARIPDEMDDPIINDLSISPDSTRLAFDYFEGGEVLVLDLVSAELLGEARAVPVDGARSPAWRSDGTLAVAGMGGSVLTFDPTTGAVGQILLAGYAEEIDADDSGRLVIKLDQPSSGDPGTSTTSYAMVDTDGQVTRMTKPFHTVVW
jgi:hypothetical protein